MMVLLRILFLLNSVIFALSGTRIGMMVLLRISGKISTEEILSTLKWSISFYFRRILPLLFVAAVIETFITPAVLWILG
jgi:stage II sporulation protein M